MPPTANKTTTPITVTEAIRSRVTVEIERMTKGPAKVTVRVDGEDSQATAEEALKTYGITVEALKHWGDSE